MIETLPECSRTKKPSRDWMDCLILDLHIAIAHKLLEKPSLLSIPITNLRAWLKEAEGEERLILKEWKRILYLMELEEICAFVSKGSPEAKRLLRYSPFCGILNPMETAQVFNGRIF